MVRYSLLVITFLSLYACSNTNRPEEISDPIADAIFLKDVSDSTRTTEQILDKILPGVIAMEKTDTAIFYYGAPVIEEESAFWLLVVGKPINKTTILATAINLQDTSIKFYILHKNAWKLIGSEKINIPVYKLEFEDLDGDGNKEIITATARNMNGNTYQEVYYYSDKAATVKYAGAFSTDYTVHKERKQIEETYEGSWYMDRSKTLYAWRQEKLVPIRRIVIALDNPDVNNGKATLEYYENTANNTDTEKLILKEPHDTNNEKQRQLWDSFFGER